MAIKNHVRSISFPSRSHPSTSAIEEGLNNLLAVEISPSRSSGSISAGLSALEELYRRTDDLLNMGSTRQVLSQERNKKFLEELLDGSLRLMDTCNVSRDLMVEARENVRVLQSGVRRRRRGGGDFGVVSSYVGFRKNMRKAARKLLVSSKNIDSRIGTGAVAASDRDDDHLVAVVHAMRRVVSVSVSILNSFLEFLSGRNVCKRESKWALVVKMLQRDHGEEIADKKREESEFESVDWLLVSSGECSHEVLGKRLDELERAVEGFEKNLDGLFRRLIRTRASLLNIISQ